MPTPGRRASPKVLIAVGGAIVVAAIVAVLLVTLSGGSSGSANVPAVGSLEGALPGAAEVRQLFAGIPQDGNSLGSPSAPVTMIEYVDLQCPYCREFESTVLPRLLETYVRSGKVRIEQRLLAFIGPDSARGREAALAAGEQGKQFDFTEFLYFNQRIENTGWLDQDMVEKTAASIPGLRVPMLVAAAKSGAVAAKASAFDAQAKTDSVTSTPTILVGPAGGTLHEVTLSSPSDLQTVKTAIERTLTG